MSYKGKKINELPVDSGVEKLLGTDANGEVKLIEKEDIGGGSGEETVINVTMVGGEFSIDKTFSELKYILKNNVPFVCKYNGDSVIFPTWFSISDNEEEINFACCTVGTWDYVSTTGMKGCSLGAIDIAITERDIHFYFTQDVTGTLAELTTEAKNDLVSAINEVNEKAGDFMVHVHPLDATTFDADKTFDEMVEAIRSGKRVFVSLPESATKTFYGYVNHVRMDSNGDIVYLTAGSGIANADYPEGDIYLGWAYVGFRKVPDTRGWIDVVQHPNVTGRPVDLRTTDKSNLVAAINELEARIAALEGGT